MGHVAEFSALKSHRCGGQAEDVNFVFNLQTQVLSLVPRVLKVMFILLYRQHRARFGHLQKR